MILEVHSDILYSTKFLIGIRTEQAIIANNSLLRKVAIMVIAFLDLLGFSWLMENNIEAAYDNLNTFNRIIKTKVIDNKTHPIDEYDEKDGLREFVRDAAVSSFCNMISISDSLILGSKNPDLFVKQVSNFVSAAFIEYSEPFREPFTNILEVENNKIGDITSEYTFRPHIAFPIMFRGGIAFGKDVLFHREGGIFEEKYSINGLNVCGLSYVKAVKLEKSGKGPRLFCNKEFVDSLTEKGRSAIRHIKDNLYEVVWTYYACEATGCCVTDKKNNVYDRINDKLLVRAVNLYNYYFANQNRNKEDSEQEYKHYEEFILLICRGILKYAYDNKVDIELTCNMLNKKLNDMTGNSVCFNKKELESFIQ